MADKKLRKPDTVTIIDVAKKASVSPSAVSLVMSGKSKGRVTQETYDRIIAAGMELGYHPSTAARSLRLGSSNTIALIVPDISNAYFANVFLGAQAEAHKNNYEVTLFDTSGSSALSEWILKSISARAFAGVVLYAADPIDDNLLEKIYPNAVLIETNHSGFASISLNVEEATAEAIMWLCELGHTRIAYLKADYPKQTFYLRYQAYQKVLASHSMPVNPGWVGQSHFDLAESFPAALALLSQTPRPTAVFCDDDILAAGVYKAARRLGLRIPEDLSVVGFNDGQTALSLEPELSTVRIPAGEVGSVSIELMLAVLQQAAPGNRNIDLELVKRESVASPKID